MNEEVASGSFMWMHGALRVSSNMTSVALLESPDC